MCSGLANLQTKSTVLTLTAHTYIKNVKSHKLSCIKIQPLQPVYNATVYKQPSCTHVHKHTKGGSGGGQHFCRFYNFLLMSYKSTTSFNQSDVLNLQYTMLFRQILENLQHFKAICPQSTSCSGQNTCLQIYNYFQYKKNV